ncbi:hypothetical protein ABN028_20125 [Actinopolymorpha sp. B17G11]|uniref:hypothetical protein n=1 Tax=Actinopolymorpha sp. B17G11 TaxID=3160861 RepID=UPI0032E3CF41
MAFTVIGVLDGVVYEVRVTGQASDPVQGSKLVRSLVKQWTGRTVSLTPAGPVHTVNPGDARSVLALLATQTKVQQVGEGAPSLAPPRPVRGVS